MPKLPLDDIARRLTAARLETGLSVPQLAPRIGASVPALYQWEKGTAAKKPNYPAEEALAALCDLLPGLTMDYIYRDRIDTVSRPLAIRLTAREMGLDPDEDAAATEARREWAARLAALV